MAALSAQVMAQYKDVVPPNVTPGVSTMNDEQKKKHDQLRAIVTSWNLAKLEQDFCDDTTLWR